MQRYRAQMDWIAGQRESMIELLEAWANINSHTDNLAGLATMLLAIKSAFAELGGQMEEVKLPPRIRIDSKGNKVEVAAGSALKITKRPLAPIKVCLGGHMDTVYPIESAFQHVEHLDKAIMRGPGVADMKGGLIVMLKALEALERSPYAEKIGWEVIINPDEEVGSPSSEHLFVQAAHRAHIGLIFEPSYADGSLVSARKGSANFTAIFRGRSAHAGRDFFAGRSAIYAMSYFIRGVEALVDEAKGITLNVGQVEGGVAANIVPDLAICRFNVRMDKSEDLITAKENLHKLIAGINALDGISAVLYESASRGPKPFDRKNEAVFNIIKECAKTLNIDLQAKPSGGVCDGNILSDEGLPTMDTLGVVGGSIHTSDEYVLLDSLMERAALSALVLMKLASGEITIPNRGN